MKIFNRVDIEHDGNEVLVEFTEGGDKVELTLSVTGGVLELPNLTDKDQAAVLDQLIDALTRARSAAALTRDKKVNQQLFPAPRGGLKGEQYSRSETLEAAVSFPPLA